MTRHSAQNIVAVLITAFILGCGSSGGPAVIWQSAGIPQKSFCRIGVLPAVNQSQLAGAGPMAEKIFINALVRQADVQVVPEGDVRQVIFRYRLLPGDSMNQKQYEEMALQLRLDALVRLKVMDIGINNMPQSGNLPYLAFEAELLEASSGRMICKAFHRRQGDDYRKTMHFGVVRTLSGLIERASEEVIADWKQKEMIGCSK